MKLEKAKLYELNRLKRLAEEEKKRKAKEEQDAAIAKKRAEM